MPTTIHRQCHLCEAHCGIAVEVEGDRVLRITGDRDDVISHGYICPKAAALVDLHTDPDRLRQPAKRVGDRFEEIGWDEALDLAAAGLRAVQERHGRDAVAFYQGNPSAHSSSLLSIVPVRQALGSCNVYSTTSVDQLPQYMSSGEMFGSHLLLPVPDIDRTDHVLVLGANPSVSNGSLMTAPGARHRLKAVRQRGGKVVVVDPRRTETAKLASEHVAVRPGGDAFLLLGMLQVVLAEGGARLGRLELFTDGLREIERLAGEWSPARAAGPAGVEAETIERLAREFAAAPRAVAYGRVGLCHQPTGSVAHWLINVLNVVTGNFDDPGGAMFTSPAFDVVGFVERTLGRTAWGRWHARVSGLPEYHGELPAAGLADEILTPGEGQVRGMLLFAGNPVLSTPNGARLDEAMSTLEWCVAVDPYVTESTRPANVILPPISALERSDVDVVFPLLSVRNQIRYNRAALSPSPDGRDDSQILIALASRLGRGLPGRVQNAGMALLGRFLPPERVINLVIQLGPYGRLRRGPRGLTLGKVMRSEHGIDLGPLEPRLPGLLRTPGKRLRLAPQLMIAEGRKLDDLAREREAALSDGFDLTLIGRRQLRSNNSWMHNSKRLMKGADRCTALLHPDDAAARGLADGQRVRVSSRVGTIELPVKITPDMRPGVVSIPHGFGHGRHGVGWNVAAAHAGASVNNLTDPALVDTLTGNAAFNATPVRIEAVEPETSVAEDGRAVADPVP
jgi:anaerobic selenocysteine-containing dehydrogenase